MVNKKPKKVSKRIKFENLGVDLKDLRKELNIIEPEPEPELKEPASDKNRKTNWVNLNFKVPKPFKLDVVKHCLIKEVSISDILLIALTEYLENHKNIIEA
jgi:hypothetical protein